MTALEEQAQDRMAAASSAPGHLRYRSGIDGMRALAVLAVVLFHGRVGWLRGGFLGVDVFFVISGYLIASLLVHEYRASGRIDLGHSRQ